MAVGDFFSDVNTGIAFNTDVTYQPASGSSFMITNIRTNLYEDNSGESGWYAADVLITSGSDTSRVADNQSALYSRVVFPIIINNSVYLTIDNQSGATWDAVVEGIELESDSYSGVGETTIYFDTLVGGGSTTFTPTSGEEWVLMGAGSSLWTVTDERIAAPDISLIIGGASGFELIDTQGRLLTTAEISGLHPIITNANPLYIENQDTFSSREIYYAAMRIS